MPEEGIKNKLERVLFNEKMENRLHGPPCNAGAEDGLEIMKILVAIYESAKTGHEIVIK